MSITADHEHERCPTVMTLIVAVVLTPACGTNNSGDAEQRGGAASTEKRPPRPEAQRPNTPPKPGALVVRNTCVAEYDYLEVLVDIPVVYQRPVGEKSRWMYYFKCRSETCSGTWISLSDMDRGEPLTATAIGTFNGKVAARSGSVTTVTWDKFYTLSVDVALGRISYVESGNMGGSLGVLEGRADVACSTSLF